MRGTRTAAHSTHPSATPIMIPRHPFMPDTLHGLHAGVYPVYRGRISTAHQGDRMNEYEQAAERFNNAVRNHAIIKAKAEEMIREADEEWENANANLAAHESSPGIPLPQYRSSLAIRGLGAG